MALSKIQWEKARQKALTYFEKAQICLTDDEKNAIEIADFGLNRLDEFGLELVTYVNTERCCAKEMVLFPGQICPEHLHPPVHGEPGKEETFRCRWGEVYLYVPGPPVRKPKANVPEDCRKYFTVWHEIVLSPGEQYTLAPNTLHWFQGGPQGAVVSEFSTKSRDELDIFSDSGITRTTRIK